ncbi:S-layer homology domain-containing protein [Candidatus Peregrinibacteria bacterium]|nr:S-layer homology domain-containing protein [Candidatus Peregrinibacteria bacterium]
MLYRLKFLAPAIILGLFMLTPAVARAATFTGGVEQGSLKKNSIQTAHFQFEFSDLTKTQSDSDADGIADVIETVAEGAEYSWQIEIDTLGFKAPVDEGSHLIVILDDTNEYLIEGSVGITGVLSDDVTPYIAIDPWVNDNLINATISHEFFHAVQFKMDESGSDFATSIDGVPVSFQGIALAESTAVWMEDRVYDAIDDYLGYISGFLDYTDYSIFSSVTPSDNDYFIYGLALWPKFLSEYFNSDAVINKLWDEYFASSLDFGNNYRIYEAAKAAVESFGGGLAQVFQEFTFWNLRPLEYEEGYNYPDPFMNTSPVQDAYTLIDESYVPALFGTNYLYFENAAGGDEFHFHIKKPEGVSFALALVGKKTNGADLNNAQKVIIEEDETMTEELVLGGLSNYAGVYAVVSPLSKNFNTLDAEAGVFDVGYLYSYIGAYDRSVMGESSDIGTDSTASKDGVQSMIVGDSRSNDTYTLQIVGYDEESVSLKWNRLADSSVAGYLLEFGTASDDYNSAETVSKAYVTSATVHDLLPGQSYYFRLRALDEDGNGILESSQEVTVTPAEWIFTDVPYLHENYDAVSSLTDWGIFQGYSDGSFQPDRQINRAELLKILVAGQGIEPDAAVYKNCFSDVKTAWYAKYVCYAKSKGWISGYADGTFRPSNTVNKVEALKMLLRTYGEKLTEGVKVNYLPYTDVSTSAWYAIYLWKAGKLAILEEAPNTRFYPSQYRTRAEMAEELYRYLVVSGLKHL